MKERAKAKGCKMCVWFFLLLNDGVNWTSGKARGAKFAGFSWLSLGWGRVGVRGTNGRCGQTGLQDWDKFRGESAGSALTSVPLFVIAKARNVVPVRRWKNSKQVHQPVAGVSRGGKCHWVWLCCHVYEWITTGEKISMRTSRSSP